MKLGHLVVTSLSVITLSSLVACSKPSPEEQKKQEAALASALASALNTPPSPAAPAAKQANAKAITLEPKTFDKLGAKLSVPQGSKVLSEDGFGVSLSFPLDEMSLNEILVNVSAAIGVTSLKTAVEDATMIGEKQIDVKKEVDKTTFQIVKAPQFNNVWVYQYKKLKTGWVKASCSGPTEQKDKVVEICASLAAK
jgi:hypothetical protein